MCFLQLVMRGLKSTQKETYNKKIIEMIRHFFLDKTNTIVEYSFQNVGLNPVMAVGYGESKMRGLLHFDLTKIKELIDDKTFANVDKLRFTLKMTNCFSVDGVPYDNRFLLSPGVVMNRASSFDLMLFKLPSAFDAGRGFDYTDDLYIRNRYNYSECASNWYFAKKCVPWKYEKDKFDLEDNTLNVKKTRYFNRHKMDEIYEDIVAAAEKYDIHGSNWDKVQQDLIKIVEENSLNSKSLNGGVYDFEFLCDEFEKYKNGEESIIVGTQHFDHGDETLSIDVTDYILESLETGINDGLCLAFTPEYESIGYEGVYYVGFFTNNTNTFFHPYIETVYDEYIMDDRESFTVGNKNSLCLYVSDEGVPTNLDEIPTCEVNGKEYEVKQVTKGVYCAVIDDFETEPEGGYVYYDKWSNIVLNGVENDDVELEFATKPKTDKLVIGSDNYLKSGLTPSIYGVDDDERLHIGEIREVTVDFRVKYTTDKKVLSTKSEYRLYTIDGSREIDIIPYTKIEKTFLGNFFMIYTEDLIPGSYFVDIKMNNGRENKYYKKILRFSVVSDVTERYR